MSSRSITSPSSSKQGRSRRRSSEGVNSGQQHYQQQHQSQYIEQTPITNASQSLNSIVLSPPDGRDGLHSFLHIELRISSEISDEYCNSLIDNGYDDVASLQDATEHDLKELGVKIGHIRRIKRAVFSNCMRSERRSLVGISSSSTASRRMMSELHAFSSSSEVAEGDSSESPQVVVSSNRSKSIEGSLLSDYARQEINNNYTPSSRGSSVDVDLASAKELLIRKQAEKIASLEAKLANAGLNTNTREGGERYDDVLSRHLSSRGGSADTSHSKKLSPEERLEQHKQRKLHENKYKEKTGVWEPPPPKKKEKSLTQKVLENDDLVLKLTSDPTHRKKIDEVEKKAKRAAKKSLGSEHDINMSPPSSNNITFDRSRSDLSPIGSNRHDQYTPNNRRSSTPGSVTFSDNNTTQQHYHHQHHRTTTPRHCCDTCGSTTNCEPDVDNPEVYYCKSCWEEYEEEPAISHSSPTSPQHNHQHHTQASPIEIEEESDSTQHALWIVHDNPQLGEKIIYSGPRRMECMLETKEPGKKNCVRIIVGDIDFSGKVKHAGIGNVNGQENDIGTECIRMRNVKGYYVDHNQAATKLSRDKSIYEFHLGEDDADLLTGSSASKTVEDFFQGCNGAIDVILDPQKDFGGWYPQKEAISGGRKIAPQFRSKGVGYIRLGDDMSENGLAFLSSNACSTFLSTVDGGRNTSTAAVRKTSASSHKPPSAKPSTKKRESTKAPRGKSNSFRRQPPPPPESDESDDESVEQVQKVSDVLKQLQIPDMKWKDKAELLSHLGKGASRPDGQSSRAAALMVIQDTVGEKNVNVHVLRASLIAAGMIGVSMGGGLVSQISWKTIMIETLKLLKSKQCGSVAKTVLAQLHGRCFTLSNSLECISHVLGVGLATTASGKGSRKSRSKSMVMDSPKPRKTSSSSGNNIEVIEWLAETTERERSMDIIDPMLDRNGLSMLINLFLSHVDHREQRCRKNVLDGLMHCVLYAVTRLEIDLTRVMRMCSNLKETNPRGWNQIFSNVKIILDEEQR